MKKLKIFTICIAIICIFTACGNNNIVTENYVDTTTSGVEQNDDDSLEDLQTEAVVADEDEKESSAVEDKNILSDENKNNEAISEEKAAEDDQTEEKVDEIEADEKYDVNLFDKSEIYYAQRSMNVRKGPGKEYEITGHFSLNDEVEVLGECKDLPWYQIKYGDEIEFVHSSLVKKDKVDVEAIRIQQEAVAQQTQQAQATQAALPTQVAQVQAPEPVAPKPPVQAASGAAKTVFIGDSRTCQMREATGGAGVVWICEYATRYDWFQNTAIPQADTCIGLGTRVVICMGVNDPNSINSYANLVNQKATDWIGRGASVYYVSLNPVDHPYEDKAPLLDSFNATMPTLLSGVRWIDTASVIKQGGFVLEDGIHYDAAGNATIFNMIYGCLK